MIFRLCVSLTRSQKALFLFAIDVALLFIAFPIALGLVIGSIDLLAHTNLLAVTLPVASLFILWAGTHRARLKSYAVDSIAQTAAVAIIAGLTAGSAHLALPSSTPLAPAFFAVYSMTFFAASVATRILMRAMVLAAYAKAKRRKKVLIYGAGQTGQQLAAALQIDDEFTAVAFVDDNTALRKMTIAGLKVYAPNDIEKIIAREGIERVILAMPSVSEFNRIRILRSLKDIGCEVLAVPSFAEMVVKGKNITPTLKPVEITKILGREKIDTDMPQCADSYQGKRILITGAGGSIGSELCRQMMECQPASLVLLDHSELALYSIMRELEGLETELHLVPVLGSVLDPILVQDILDRYDIEVVLHAAAYKHVPMVELNTLQGLENNVIGTKIIADAARRAQVERFILISSDKAVRPTSTMGASKRLAEMVVQDLATRSETTQYSMVRFGNVLGSSGSVIPLFQDQIRRGGPVTVTDDSVSRYFMTISEAVRLVLLAGTYSRGGDVFVLDMGKPVYIHDVARQMIEGSGFTVRDNDNPNGDIEIQFIGLRPGEKLHEELLIGSDMLTTPHSKILRAQETHPSEIEVANILSELRKAFELRNEEHAAEVIAQWVESEFQDAGHLTNMQTLPAE